VESGVTVHAGVTVNVVASFDTMLLSCVAPVPRVIRTTWFVKSFDSVPSVLLPILGLAALALVPVFYKRRRPREPAKAHR